MLTMHRVTEILKHLDMYNDPKVYEALTMAAEESHNEAVSTNAGIIAGVMLELTNRTNRVRIMSQYCMGCGNKHPCLCDAFKKTGKLTDYVNSEFVYPETPEAPQ